MTRNKFRSRIGLIILLSLLILLVSFIDFFIFNPQVNPVQSFLKEMSTYILIAVTPYVAMLFAERRRFLEKLESEWRRVVDVKDEIIAFTHEPTRENWQKAMRKTSQSIDYLRAIYSNVGEDTEYLGFYPFETLHDFRKELEAIEPRNQENDNGSPERMEAARKKVIEYFQAFRDVFLIEFDLTEPDYPIIARGMTRLRKSGMTRESYERAKRKHQTVLKTFGMKGEIRKE